MQKTVLILLASLLTSMATIGQDIGVEKLIYPKKSYASYELSSFLPIYWSIKNYGDDSLDNRVITLELIADGTSPKFSLFRAEIPKDWSAPLDDRDPKFYQFGFHELFDISSVMGLITPEHAAGDTIQICLVATVEGDIDHSNDSLCFAITLEERPNRDLVLHILNPENDTEVHPNHTTSFDLSFRNDGDVPYTNDSIYGQMAIEKGGKTLDLVNIASALPGNIESGDSAVVTFDIPWAKEFPLGDFFMGFRAAWPSKDGVFELGESNTDNNIAYVRLKATASSIFEKQHLELKTFVRNESIVISGGLESSSVLNVRIITINGQEVHNSKNQVNGQASLSLPISNLSKGAYLLIIENDLNEFYSEKFILD